MTDPTEAEIGAALRELRSDEEFVAWNGDKQAVRAALIAAAKVRGDERVRILGESVDALAAQVERAEAQRDAARKQADGFFQANQALAQSAQKIVRERDEARAENAILREDMVRSSEDMGRICADIGKIRDETARLRSALKDARGMIEYAGDDALIAKIDAALAGPAPDAYAELVPAMGDAILNGRDKKETGHE